MFQRESETMFIFFLLLTTVIAEAWRSPRLRRNSDDKDVSDHNIRIDISEECSI
jgi:hypothetical protein